MMKLRLNGIFFITELITSFIFDKIPYKEEINRINFELDRLKGKVILVPKHVIYPEDENWL